MSEGGMDAEGLAMLGVLTAVNAPARRSARARPASSWCSSC